MSLKVEKSSTVVSVSNNLDISAEGKNTKKTGLRNTASALFAYSGYKATKFFGNKLLSRTQNSFIKESMFSSFILNGREARKIFDSSGLKEKGVILKNITYANPKISAENNYLKNLKYNIKNLKLKKFFDDIKALQTESCRNITTKGLSSFYEQDTKTIVNNLNKLGMAVPHEMGHAKNYTSKNPLLKILIKSKRLSVLAPLILAVAIFRSPKKEGEESKSTIGKNIDFIKDNCVGLTAACMAPELIEEGLASIRGTHIAKNFLTPEKLKAINKLQARGWLTYVIKAGITVATVFAANTIRNTTALKPKEERPQNSNVNQRLERIA